MTKEVDDGSRGVGFTIQNTATKGGQIPSHLLCLQTRRTWLQKLFPRPGYSELWLEKNKVADGIDGCGRGGCNNHEGGRHNGGNKNCGNLEIPSAQLAWADTNSSVQLAWAVEGSLIGADDKAAGIGVSTGGSNGGCCWISNWTVE